MENLFRGIVKAKDDDLIIFSDEDEIPNPAAISHFKKNDFKFLHKKHNEELIDTNSKFIKTFNYVFVK